MPPDSLEDIESQLGADWPHLRAARQLSKDKLLQISEAVEHFDSEDTSIVVMGSLARAEFTDGSDIDWYLLIDGWADKAHRDVLRNVGEAIRPFSSKPVGREGTFGDMVFSHSLIHDIGGDVDTNLNTTRRLLLLLESRAVGRPDAWRRVVRGVLDRYIAEDRGLWRGSGPKLPHFLVNDLSRLWRTMAVDFAYKLNRRGGQGAALRNIKLRMSRKLIYISGLLACYDCHLGFTQAERSARYSSSSLKGVVVEFLEERFAKPPLDVVAGVLLRYPHLYNAARQLLESYDEFVGILADDEKRQHMERLAEDQMDTDPIFQRARQLSHAFRDALTEVFFDQQSGLGDLTKGGIF